VLSQAIDFSVQVVSDAFTGKVCRDTRQKFHADNHTTQTTLQRHRMIYTALSDEIDNQGVHALSLKTKTVAESIAT
jgi:stress-induced morphogen